MRQLRPVNGVQARPSEPGSVSAQSLPDPAGPARGTSSQLHGHVWRVSVNAEALAFEDATLPHAVTNMEWK